MSNITAVPLAPVRRAYVVWLVVGLALALVAAAALAVKGGGGATATASGLRYRVDVAGEGPKPTDADVALITYKGRLVDGTVFDQSQGPTPMPVAGVVPGFAEGLKLMSKGAKYRFWIPPALAYGAEAKGPIPANSTLVFDVELIDFLPQAVIQQMQQQQQMGAMPAAPGAPPPPPPAGR